MLARLHAVFRHAFESWTRALPILAGTGVLVTALTAFAPSLVHAAPQAFVIFFFSYVFLFVFACCACGYTANPRADINAHPEHVSLLLVYAIGGALLFSLAAFNLHLFAAGFPALTSLVMFGVVPLSLFLLMAHCSRLPDAQRPIASASPLRHLHAARQHLRTIWNALPGAVAIIVVLVVAAAMALKLSSLILMPLGVVGGAILTALSVPLFMGCVSGAATVIYRQLPGRQPAHPHATEATGAANDSNSRIP